MRSNESKWWRSQRSLCKIELVDLERRSFNTYTSRLQASRRLEARQHAWSTSLVATSTAMVVASIALLSTPNIYGESGPALLAGVSVTSLVVSLVTASLNYAGRARDMFLNYRKVQRLSVEAETMKRDPKVSLREVRDLQARYQALLDETENHTDADFARAFPAKEASRGIVATRALSVMPYLSLIVPLGLLVPIFTIWI